jgi:adenylate cyclase
MAIEQPRRNHRSFALMPTLMLSIGLLVLGAVGSVLAVNWFADRRVVQDLASRLVMRVLSAEEDELRDHLDAAVRQGDFIASAIRSGRYRLSDPAFADFVAGTFAAAPQIDAMVVSDPSGNALRVLRVATDAGFQIDHFNVSTDNQVALLAEQIRTRKEPYWGRPYYRAERGETYLAYRLPIWKGESYLGFAAFGISTLALSRFAKSLSNPPTETSFVLYGNNRVLAHPSMIEGSPDRSADGSFPPLATIGDPVIANFDSLPPIDERLLKPPPGILAREPSVNGEPYLVFAQKVSDYSDLPLTVGAYFLRRAVDAPARVIYVATMLALAMLGVSLIAAALIATAIARPMLRAAKGATAIGNLDFDQVAPLAGSYFREINSMAISFNAMLDGLRAFGRYVPRSLVSRLIREGRLGAGSEERILAIMFTDLVSFTATCESMTAAEVAAFINQHLSLVSACVEREGGTIDKFIGDALMAFWGAPGRMDNPAAGACHAAVAIAAALAADNKRRIVEGMPPARIRIGIHMGPVVVGDIGAPNRINYTIVGDAVNAAQRLESLGKTVDPGAEAIVLVSREIFLAAPAGFEFIEHGSHSVKGKHERIEVYQLVGGPHGTASRVAAALADIGHG